MPIVRFTIAVDSETRDMYKRMADAAGVSLGKCIGDWLTDTVESAEFVTLQMERARMAPKIVMRELVAASGGLHAEVKDLEATLRRGGWQAHAQQGAAAPTPPSSNTGVIGKSRRGEK